MDGVFTSFSPMIFSCPLIPLSGQKHEQTVNLKKTKAGSRTYFDSFCYRLMFMIVFFLLHVFIFFFTFLYSHILLVKLTTNL